MNFVNHKALFEKLKAHVSSWQPLQLVFSYDLKGNFKSSDTLLRLHQEQTGFSLNLSMQILADSVQVTRFALTTNDQLEEQCPPLYDAALIELAIQGLDLLYSAAKLTTKMEVIYLLPRQEADHLIPFKEFFSSVSSRMTSRGKCTLLELPAWSAYHETFKEETAFIMAQVHQKMWRMQKAEPLVRQYLKAWAPLTRLDLKTFLTLPEERQKVENVINLPGPSKQSSKQRLTVPC